MTSIRIAALTVLALATGGRVVQAQFPGSAGMSNRPIHLVVSGGLTLPSGELKDFHETGFHYDASLILTLPGFPIAIRPEFSLTKMKLKDTGLPSFSEGSETQMIGAFGNIEIPIAAGLYLIGGVGGVNLKTVLETSGTDIEKSQTKLAIDAGAGFRFKLGGIAGFVEGRMGSASYDNGVVGYSKAQFIPVTFGLVF